MVVVRTERGRALLDDALDVVDTLEAEHGRLLSPERLSTLKDALSTLLGRIDRKGTLGRD